jgi:hypothetical protein
MDSYTNKYGNPKPAELLQRFDLSPHQFFLDMAISEMWNFGQSSSADYRLRSRIIGNFVERAFSLKILFSSPGRSSLDDCTQGNSHAVTCSPDNTSDGLTRGHCMRECRSLPCSPVPDRDGLDATTEKRVLLFQPIQCRVQVRDNCLSLISDDDQFDIDLFV